jgi:hypothetical protein
MDNDLTISTLAFTLAFSDKDAGSERREVSRGVNLPEVMTIKSQTSVDSATKLPTRRTVLRFDRHLEFASGAIGPVSAYLVVAVPQDTGVTSADVLAVVERIAQVIQEDDSGLDLADEIFVSGQQ